MKKNIIKNISLAALMSALIFILTFTIQIPYFSGMGYFNVSDALIIFTTIFFGPYVGIASAIIGTVFADLAAGYANFMIFTAIAKGLEALTCFLLYYYLNNKKHLKCLTYIISPLMMVLVYFVSYIIFYGINYAFINSGFDLIQGAVGSLLSLVLLSLFRKINIPHYEYKNNKINHKVN